MQIQICSREVNISQGLQAYIERRIHFALERFAQRIRKIRVQLRDLNGPRGGEDKSCQLTIALAPAATLVIEGRSASAHAAIDSVVEKAANSIVRRIKRKERSRRTRSVPRSIAGMPQPAAVVPENE
jgi:putative sigma-54 modulation protein